MHVLLSHIVACRRRCFWRAGKATFNVHWKQRQSAKTSTFLLKDALSFPGMSIFVQVKRSPGIGYEQSRLYFLFQQLKFWRSRQSCKLMNIFFSYQHTEKFDEDFYIGILPWKNSSWEPHIVLYRRLQILCPVTTVVSFYVISIIINIFHNVNLNLKV